MTSRNRRLTQKADIKRRAKAPPTYPGELCVVPGCGRLTQRSDAKGLNEKYCKRHRERLRTHGHPVRRSYTKAELVPFRNAAREWFEEHREDGAVQMAIRSLEGLMASQGKSKDAYHQRSLAPEAKAQNTLARLHEASKTGAQIFLIVLTIQASHAELGPWGADGWLYVQISKQAKRLRGAAGTHYPDAPSRYPRSEGLYLRHLGRMIEERASVGIGGDTIDRIRERARLTIRRPHPAPRPPSNDTRDGLRRMQALTAALRGGSRSVTVGG